MSNTRMTIQRRSILSAVEDSHKHISAETIYHQLKPVMPDLSLSTVYRNLKTLAKAGKVSVADFGEGMVFETVQKEPHHHLVCLSCGDIQTLDHALVQPFFEQIEHGGFKVTTTHLCVYGLCAKCQASLG